MKIAIIHLTDMHFSTEKDYTTKLKALCQAVATEVRGINSLYCVLSGDLVFAGKSQEYEVVSKFLSVFRTLVISDSKDAILKFIIVPGNHDCNFYEYDSQLRKNQITNMNYQTIGDDKSVVDACMVVQT